MGSPSEVGRFVPAAESSGTSHLVTAVACFALVLSLPGCGAGGTSAGGGPVSPELSCPSSSSLPQDLTIGNLDPQLLSTIGAGGGLYSQYVSTTPGLPVDPGDCAVAFPAADGKRVQILVKGPASRNGATYYVPAYPTRDGQTVLAYLADAIAYASGANTSGKTYGSVVLPKATYEVEDFPGCDDARGSNGSQHWEIADVSDLVIDGQGSTLNFSGLCKGIEVSRAQRIVLRNFTLDWPRVQLASLGTVQSISSDTSHPTMNIIVDPQFPVDSSTVVDAITSWDRTHGYWSLDAPADDEGMDPAHTAYLGNQTLQVGLFIPGFRVGETVILRHFSGEAAALTINASQDVTVDNVTVLGATGNAFQFGMGRGFHLMNSRVERSPGRLISVAGDGIHMAGNQGDILVEGNTIGYQGDDGLNLNASMWCNSMDSGSNAQPCNASLAGPSGGSATSLAVYGWWVDVWHPGDVLGFFGPDLFFTGASAVEGVTSVANVSTTLQFRDPSPATARFLADLTFGSARYVIRNNAFLHNRARGALLQTAEGMVVGNTFDGQTMHSIYIVNSPFWGEGPGAQNVTIAGNSISNVGNYFQASSLPILGAVVVATEDASANTIASPAPLHQNLVFSGNTIQDVPGPGLFVSAANNVIMEGNRLMDTNQVTSPVEMYGTANSNGAIVITGASNGYLHGNQMIGSSGPTSIDSSSTSGIKVN